MNEKELREFRSRFQIPIKDEEIAYQLADSGAKALVYGAGFTALVAGLPGDETDVVSRAFAPGAGIDEDPVTGSAHAVLTPYWAARLGRDRFNAFQASRRGGRLTCRLDGARVILGGRCVTVIEGVMRL